MNILITLGVGLFALCLLWVAQSAALTLAGEPLAAPFRYKTQKPLVKYTTRTMIHASWLIILVGTQIVLGVPLLDALHRAFPTPLPWRDMVLAFAIMFVPATGMYLLYLALGWARFEPQGETGKRRGKLFRRFIGPWPLATLEEAVFRGVLLEQLIRSLPASRAYEWLAIVVVATTFSFVHFIKPRAGSSAWQMAWGYFIVGCLFGLGYVAGGRSLWVPIMLHGAAVFVIEIARLYIVFEKPPWLMGYSESPQSGVVGTLVILGMAIAVMALI